MLKRIVILLSPVVCLIFLGLGYWLGMQKAEQIVTLAMTQNLRSEIIEAQSDSAVLQIFAQKRYPEAENIAKMRYYNRVLTISELGAANPAMTQRAHDLTQEARQHWQLDPYVLASPTDNAKLLSLMK